MSDETPPTRRTRRANDDIPSSASSPVRDAVETTVDGAAVRDDLRGRDDQGLGAVASDVDEYRLPTAQLERAAFGEHALAWEPPEPTRPPSLAPWALGLAVIALATSLFVGWTLPLGAVAAIAAVISLRRPLDGRRTAVWALVLALLSVLYSAGWLLWALPQLPTG